MDLSIKNIVAKLNYKIVLKLTRKGQILRVDVLRKIIVVVSIFTRCNGFGEICNRRTTMIVYFCPSV